MFNQFFKYLFMFCISFMITGCSTIFSAQEWSDNYALMDGVQSTSPQMIDGNLETIGQAAIINNTVYALNDNGEFIRNDPKRMKLSKL